jgi:FdhD protein
MKPFIKKDIFRVKGGKKDLVEDNIALEKQLRLLINGGEVLNLLCSPSMVRELVTGLVMTEGIIEGNLCLDRMSIEYNDAIIVDIPAEGNVSKKGAIRTSGCIGGVTYEHGEATEKIGYKGGISAERLIELFREFQNISKPYQLTGCIHSAAIASEKHIIVHGEDIGRHNAVDKVVGYCLIENIPMDDKIMLASGRLSSEIAYKCARWKIPIVVSRTAPTLKAVNIAEESGVTLIGFLREKRFNIYTGEERIL